MKYITFVIFFNLNYCVTSYQEIPMIKFLKKDGIFK